MAIGTKEQLLGAAAGKMPAKSYAQQPTSSDPESAYKAALERRSTLSSTAQERTEIGGLLQGAANVTGGLRGDITGMESVGRSPSAYTSPTSMYETMVRGLARSRGGLDTDKGKYGGFYSAGDLQSAIEGAAIGFRERATQDLRREALNRYAAIDPMYSEAKKEPSRFAMRGVTSAMPSVQPYQQKTTPGGYIERVVKPQLQYTETLGDWYASQAAPAEEYLQTAQQLETTPLSRLAESIAVSQYGMNPDLASSKFRGLDQQYWQNRRNERYIEDYGVPYDEYMALVSEGERQQRQEQEAETFQGKESSREIENLTGFKSTSLGNLVGQTPSQMYATLFDDEGQERTVQYEDPDTNQTVQQNASGVIQRVRQYINSNDKNSLSKLLNSVRGQSGQDDIARLIMAMMYVGGAKPEGINLDLNLAGYMTEG